MIKTILVPMGKEIKIDIPKEYIGKKIEVIAFAIDEINSNYEEPQLITHLLSEPSLALDWLNKEEDEAWKNL